MTIRSCWSWALPTTSADSVQGTTSLRGGQSILANRPRTIGGIGYLFFVQGFALLGQCVDFVRCEVAFVLGHVAFAIGDDVA